MKKIIIPALLFLGQLVNAQYLYWFSPAQEEFMTLENPFYVVPKDSLDDMRDIPFNFTLEARGMKATYFSPSLSGMSFGFRKDGIPHQDDLAYYIVIGTGGWPDMPDYDLSATTAKFYYTEQANGLKATVFELSKLAYAGYGNETVTFQYWIYSDGKVKLLYGANTLSSNHPLSKNAFTSFEEVDEAGTDITYILTEDPANPTIVDKVADFAPFFSHPALNQAYIFSPSATAVDEAEVIEDNYNVIAKDKVLSVVPRFGAVYSLAVFDMNGKIVMSSNGVQGLQTMNLLNSPAGIYLVKIDDGTGITVKKISLP